MPPIIKVENLSKAYRLGQVGRTSLKEELNRYWDKLRGKHSEEVQSKELFWALNDISFEVNEGEVLGIIGKNGAGKSTLLKILSRITEPTSGRAIMHGRVSSLLEVGTGFHPDLTGRENIYLNGSMLGMNRKEIARKFDEIVAFAEIDQFIDTPVKRYSSGMYVRLAFAVAAHLEPEILIVDEVLAVGDMDFRQKCLSRMRSLSQSEGLTILFISHSMPAIRRLCPKCIVLNSGKLQGIFESEEAIHIYNQKFQQSDDDIETGHLKRDWNTTAETARIERIRIQSPKQLSFNSPCTFEFTVSAQRDLTEIMLGLAFNTEDGQRVLTLDSDTDGQLLSLKKGINKVSLSLPRLPLSPTRYLVSASIFSRNHAIDIIDGFAIWEVHSGEHDQISDRGFGGCRITPTIQVSTS